MVRRVVFQQQVLEEISGLKHEIAELTRTIKGRSQESSVNVQTMEAMMANIRDAVQALVAKVNDQRTVIDSVTTMLQGLRDQISSAQGDLDAAGEADAANLLAEISAALDSNTDALAKATAQNTDASDEVHASSM